MAQVDSFERDAVAYVKPNHGTTTLGFIFKHGVIIAVDSRASQGSYVCTCPAARRASAPASLARVRDAARAGRSVADSEKGDRDQPVPAGDDGGRRGRLPVLAAEPGAAGAALLLFSSPLLVMCNCLEPPEQLVTRVPRACSAACTS